MHICERDAAGIKNEVPCCETNISLRDKKLEAVTKG